MNEMYECMYLCLYTYVCMYVQLRHLLMNASNLFEETNWKKSPKASVIFGHQNQGKSQVLYCNSIVVYCSIV